MTRKNAAQPRIDARAYTLRKSGLVVFAAAIRQRGRAGINIGRYGSEADAATALAWYVATGEKLPGVQAPKKPGNRASRRPSRAKARL